MIRIFGWVGDKFGELPPWARWTTGIFGVLLLSALFAAWGERNYVAATAEFFVAYIVKYGGIIGSIGAGIWVGALVSRRTTSWLGTIIGVLVFLVVGFVVFMAGDAIPGVGWRLELMRNADCYDC